MEKPIFKPPVFDENTKALFELKDALVYFGLCVCTFGFAYLVRLVITTAIKKSR
jgi:hypothetical protein